MAERADAVHPFWSGVLTFGLVSIPVELFAAVRSSRASLRMLGPEGQPLRRRYVSPKDGRPLEPDEIVRGFEVAPGQFVTVTDEELEALEPGRSREIDLRRFVPLSTIDPVYCDRPYFLLPQGEVDKPYRLLARTMEETGQAGVASFVLRGREQLVAIFAEGGLLRAETLRHEDEVRSAEAVGLPAPVKVPKERTKALRDAIEALAEDELAPEELTDERAEAMRTLARKKGKAALVHVEEMPASEQEEDEVVDIVALLRERLGAKAAPAPGLEQLTKKELLERAKELDIAGRSKMTRDELLAALGLTGAA